MPHSAQDQMAQTRAVVEQIAPTRLRALQAAGAPAIDVREPGGFDERPGFDYPLSLVGGWRRLADDGAATGTAGA